jgi:hypothetical protein
LSFALERIGPLAAIIITVFYLLALYLFALPNTPENPFASIYSETLIKTTRQHLLLLIGFDTLIYRKYYDTPPILVSHQDYFLVLLPGSEALLKSGIGKGNRRCEYYFYFCLLFLFYLAMESSPFGFLFRNTTTTVVHEDEPPPPPPAQLDPFKIPIKLLNVLWITAIQEMELSIRVITYFLYINYVSCSSVQVFRRARLRGSFSHYH